jgi:small subunit ribosomal protein S10
MQALSSRVRVQPFTSSSRPVLARVQGGSAARLPVRSQLPVARAAAVDVSDYEEESELPFAASQDLAPAGDKVRLRIRMRSYEVDLLNQCVNQIRAVADASGALFKGPGARLLS